MLRIEKVIKYLKSQSTELSSTDRKKQIEPPSKKQINEKSFAKSGQDDLGAWFCEQFEIDEKNQLRKYVADSMNPNGFMTASQRATLDWANSNSLDVEINQKKRKFTFIAYNDGDHIHFVEEYFLDHIQDKGRSISSQKKPVAGVITVSKIMVVDGKIDHQLISDTTLLFDESCEEMFSKGYGNFEKKYNSTNPDYAMNLAYSKAFKYAELTTQQIKSESETDESEVESDHLKLSEDDEFPIVDNKGNNPVSEIKSPKKIKTLIKELPFSVERTSSHLIDRFFAIGQKIFPFQESTPADENTILFDSTVPVDHQRKMQKKMDNELLSIPLIFIQEQNPGLFARSEQVTSRIYKDKDVYCADNIIKNIYLTADLSKKPIKIPCEILFRYEWENDEWLIKHIRSTDEKVNKLLLAQYPIFDKTRKIRGMSHKDEISIEERKEMEKQLAPSLQKFVVALADEKPQPGNPQNANDEVLNAIKGVNQYLTKRSQQTLPFLSLFGKYSGSDYYNRRASWILILDRLNKYLSNRISLADLETSLMMEIHKFSTGKLTNDYAKHLCTLYNSLRSNAPAQDIYGELYARVDSYTNIYDSMDELRLTAKEYNANYEWFHIEKNKPAIDKADNAQKIYAIHYESLNDDDKKDFLDPKRERSAEYTNSIA